MKRFWLHFGIALGWLIVACLTLQAVVKGEEAQPSPQTPGKNWQPVIPAPAPPVPPPAPRAPTPRRDFATPPTDGPNDPPAPPAPPAPPPAPPAPAPAVPPPAPVAPVVPVARLSLESQGVPIILGNTGNINLGTISNPAPAPAAAPRPAADPAPAQSLAPILVAVATAPATQSLIAGASRRIAGALGYLATGKCPSSAPAVTTATPAAFVAAYPAQQVQLMAYSAPAPPAAAPAPTPQAWLAAPAPNPAAKCRFFGQ
jgi:hypothetical protein